MLSAKRFFSFCRLPLCWIGFLLSFANGYSQHTSLADQYFAADQFHKAASLYDQIYRDDSTDYWSAFKLAECYRRMFSYEKAQHYYHIVQANEAKLYPLSVFYYALMLKNNQHLEHAIQAFDQFIRYYNTSDLSQYIVQAKKEKQGCYLALMEASHIPQYQFSRMGMPINSEYNEYAPAILQRDSMLVITSSRIKSTKGRINNRLGEGFTDNLVFINTAKGWELVKNSQHFNITNSRWSDGSGCFNKEKNKYYFTSCQNDGFCNIYVSILKDGKWQEPLKLNKNINLSGTNAKHPALSASGDSLFFVSDRPGGYGNTDIWMSISSGQEHWGPSMNLGKKINTPFNDISPFYLSKEKVLIFASDGHEGLGGMDLYWAENTGYTDIFLQNLGAPFNSSKDDCYLIIEEGQGYMASNREQSFDIYTFSKPVDQTVKNFFLGNFDISSSTAPVAVFQDMITDAGTEFPLNNKSIMVVKSSEKERLRNGSTRFILSSDVDDIMLEKFKRESQREQQDTLADIHITLAKDALLIDSTGAATTLGHPVLTLQTHHISVNQKGEVRGKLLLAGNDSVLSAVVLNLMTNDGKLAKISTTNDQGEFRFVNLKPDTDYHIFVETSSVPLKDKIVIKDLVLRAYGDEMTTFRYENIYFDFNQSGLRKEAKVVLKELAGFYHQYPDMQIEINAFTDSTGDADYNLLLSQQRGQSAFDYLIELGVDRSAIVINAQGISTSIASSNSFVSQQLNRRVEFEIIGRGIHHNPLYETWILKPKIDLRTLAEALHMSVEELKSINGFESEEEAQGYKPIRVNISAGLNTEDFFYDILEK